MSDLQSQLFNSDDLNARAREVLEGNKEAQNEYDLHLKLMWEYYRTYKQQRGEDVDLTEFFAQKELQEEAFDAWNEHGLQLAFQGLANDQRPAVTAEQDEKVRPADGTVAETDTPTFLPTVTLDDVLKRRAEIQA
ncbi:MAG: hypothetical protein WD049_01355 [Candidatus Paceibacterota bacterium]